MAVSRTRVRRLASVTSVAMLAIMGTGSLAEPADTKPPVPDQSYIKNEPIETCMERWDPDTHMTKDQWRATCIRMKKEREPPIKDR